MDALEGMTIFARERLRERLATAVADAGRRRVTADDLARARAAGGMRRARPQGLEAHPWPVLAGAYEMFDPSAPVAVCTLASEDLVRELGVVPGAALVGRAFTENLGVEKVAINVLANPAIRVLVLCGTESRHRVGQTLMALHTRGAGEDGRVIGSEGPLPLVPNLPVEAQHLFREKIEIVDLIGEHSVAVIRAATAAAAAASAGPWPVSWQPSLSRLQSVEEATAPPAEDRAGFLLISVGPYRDRIVIERYSRDAVLLAVFEGRTAEDVCRSAVAAGAVTELTHAAYLGREALKAETALRFGLQYEQDRPLEASAAPAGD